MTEETPDQPARRRLLAASGAALVAAHLPAGRVHAQGEGPVALITGTSSGFGRLTSLAMARAGHRVAATMRGLEGANATAAAELSAIAEAEGLELVPIEIDVDDAASVERGVAEAAERLGPVDVLVNNAGIGIPVPVELSFEAAEQVLRTNLFGALRMNRAVLPMMRERGSGLIVQVTSGLGRLTMPTHGAYCASKHALEALTEAMAYELHPLGIEAAIVEPSGYDTRFKENARRYFEETMAGLSPQDAARAESYGEHFEVAERILRERSTPPPQEVADAILALAEAEPGARPLRVIVGAGLEDLEPINEAIEAFDARIVRGLGVAGWLTLG